MRALRAMYASARYFVWSLITDDWWETWTQTKRIYRQNEEAADRGLEVDRVVDDDISALARWDTQLSINLAIFYTMLRVDNPDIMLIDCVARFGRI